MIYSFKFAQRYFAPAFDNSNGWLAMYGEVDLGSSYRSGMYVKSIYGVMQNTRIVPPVPPAVDATLTLFTLDKAVLVLQDVQTLYPATVTMLDVEEPNPSFGPTNQPTRQIKLPGNVRNTFLPGEVVVKPSGKITIGMECGLGDVPYNYLAAGESTENGIFITLELEYPDENF